MSDEYGIPNEAQDSMFDDEQQADPIKVEEFGVHLAANLPQATAVLHWDRVADAVMGHVVARERSLRRHTMVIDQGIFTIYPPLPEASAVVVLYPSNPEMAPEAVSAAVRSAGHTVAAVLN